MERYRTAPHAVKRKTAILSLKSKPLQQYVGLMILILVGAAIGAMYVRNSGLSRTGLEGTGFFIQDILSADAAKKGILSLSASSFFPMALLLCIAYLLGLCTIGTPFEILIPIIHGAWLGTSMACIDMNYGVKGLGICILFIMPQAIISSIAIMVACREGIRFSWSVAMTIFRGVQNPLLNNFRTYCYKYVICFLFAVIASIIEAFSVVIFANIFFT